MTSVDADATVVVRPKAPEHELTAVERARKTLEDEIDAHKKQVIQKTRELNKLVSTARLPPELLTEIFMHYAVGNRYLSHYGCMVGDSYARERSKRWIKVAHVCHHWREVALSSPRLWSEFTVDRLEWTQEMLARSKHAPLHLTITGVRADPEAVKLAIKQLPRIQSLVFRMGSMESLVSQLELGGEAPLLKSLTVSSTRPTFLSVSQDSEILFDKVSLPQLTQLELVDTRVSWHNPIFRSTLTHVTFRSSDTFYEYQNASIHSVLRALENMPALQTLDLKGVLPLLPEDSPPLIDDLMINLPQLRSLVLGAPAKTTAFILQHIAFPANTTLQLDCSDYRPSEVTHLCPVLSSKLCPDPENGVIISPLLTLSVSEIAIKAWSEEYSMSVLDPTPLAMLPATTKPRLYISLTRVPVCTSMSFFSAILAALPLASVRTMHFTSSGFVMDKKEWLRTCEGMVGLKELGVSQYGESGLPEALGSRVPVPGARPPPPAPAQGSSKKPRRKMQQFLPSLRTLHLTGVRVRRTPPDVGDDDGVVPHYLRMLAARRRSKVPLALRLRECVNASREDVERLRKDAASVEWDEVLEWIDEDEFDEDEDFYDDEEEFYDPYSDDEPPLFFFPW